MSAHTPSPHRFLAPRPHSSHKSKPTPQSALRYGSSVQTPKPVFSSRQVIVSGGQTPRITPAKRFVLGTPGNKQRDHEHENPSSTPLAKPQRKLKRIESIEETSERSQSAPQDDRDSGDADVLQSIEHDRTANTHNAQDAESDEEEMLLDPHERHKRRRITPNPPSPPQMAPRIPRAPPRTPAPGHNSASSHRFLVPALRTPAAFQTPSRLDVPAASLAVNAAGTHRPRFLLPQQPLSPSKSTSATPLPETFSPSRRNQKYLPGGLASTMQTWIIEAANTGYAAQNSGVVYGRDKEDGVRLRLRILKTEAAGKGGWSARQGRQEAGGEVECWSGGVVFVRGEAEAGLYNLSRAPSLAHDEREVRVLLAGLGGARGRGVRLKEGCVVGIRAPLWDIDVESESWIVGVDWVVL